MDVIWEKDVDNIGYRLTKFQPGYEDEALYFWKRDKDQKTKEWSKWKQVTAVDFEEWQDDDDDEEGKPEQPCENCAAKLRETNIFYGLLAAMAGDAKQWMDYFNEFSEQLTPKRRKKDKKADVGTADIQEARESESDTTDATVGGV